MKIAIIGFGKMGKTIEGLLSNEDQIVFKINSKNAQEVKNINHQNCDVAIEFSLPEVAFENISTLLKNGVPVVSGTTGWLDKRNEIEQLCKAHDGAFLYASNFSIGVNLFFAINKYVAKLLAGLDDYKTSMKEIHHIHKLDAPSGTAISLAEDIIEERQNLNSWTIEAGGNDDELPIESIREGEVTGTHIINYKSAVDTITIGHEAHSRNGFALGSIHAARWIIGKKGIFSMSDVLIPK